MVFRKGAYTDIFKQREINILKYLRPILLQVIKSLIFQEEKEKYCKIAEYFISSNKPQAVIKHDGSILVCNNKFTDQITQSNITALPPQLQKKIANFISHQSLLSKNSSDKENPVYIRFNHRLYQTNISAITQDHQLSDSTWLLTLNRISNIDSILQRTLFDAKVTKRETEIIRLLQTGISSADVANQLEISYHTTRTHVRNIYKKLGVSSSRELLAFLHQPSII
jgi:DNA-binding CsgD family transcriptional regulator